MCPPLPGKAIKLSFSTSKKKSCLFRVFGWAEKKPVESSCSERRTEGTRGQVHPRVPSFHPLFFLFSLFLKTVETFFLKFRSKEEKNKKNSQNLMTAIQMSCFAILKSKFTFSKYCVLRLFSIYVTP